MRKELVTVPVLTLPIDEGRFVLDVDASDLASDAVVSQEQCGQERVVAYFSHKHSGTERNYCTTRKELLAMVNHSVNSECTSSVVRSCENVPQRSPLATIDSGSL